MNNEINRPVPVYIDKILPLLNGRNIYIYIYIYIVRNARHVIKSNIVDSK